MNELEHVAYNECMNNANHTVSMQLVGVVGEGAESTPDAEFNFAMQARYKDTRTVQYKLTAADAEILNKQITAFIKHAKKLTEK